MIVTWKSVKLICVHWKNSNNVEVAGVENASLLPSNPTPIPLSSFKILKLDCVFSVMFWSQFKLSASYLYSLTWSLASQVANAL